MSALKSVIILHGWVEARMKKVLEEDALERWWGTHVLALEMTPKKALLRNPEKLVLVVKSYSDASFS